METILIKLETLLFGLNYQVFLKSYPVEFEPGEAADWYLAKALGPGVVVGGLNHVTPSKLLEEVRSCLNYPGESGSGPFPENVRSGRFQTLVMELLEILKNSLVDAQWICQFWIKDGHPAYPVFWDFAFVIVGQSGGFLLIGSSSD